LTPYLLIGLGLISLVSLPVLKRINLRLAIPAAILIRILLFFTTPELSEDPYRYLWDGEQLAKGRSPYQVAPAQIGEKREFYSRIRGQTRPSIYFPLAQLLFLLAYLIQPSGLLGLKFLILISDLITIILMIRFLPDHLGHYLISPLVLIESHLGLHLDTFLIPLSLGFIVMEGRRPLLASLLLTASILIRPTLLPILPIFLLRKRDRKTLLPLLLLLGMIPYFHHPPSAFIAYLRHWEFNGSSYYLMKILVGHSLHARIISYLLYLLIYPIIIDRDDAYPLALGLFFLLSPTVYPWYLLPLLIFSLRYETPLLLLCYGSLLSYAVLIPYWTSGRWEENWVIILLEYLPVYLLMIRHFSLIQRLSPLIWRK